MARRKTTKSEPGTPPSLSEIKNSMRTIRIDVTPEDIKKGTPMDPQQCAAAQAIMRVTGASECYVHRGVCYVKTKQSWTRFATSGDLRFETMVFDRGGMFVPGEYDLRSVPVSMIAPSRPKKKGMTPARGAGTPTHTRRKLTHVRHTARFRNLPPKEGEE